MLSLHTPNELSSICGQLGLRILQKASVSIEQVMKYMENSHKDKIITMEVAEKVLTCMWETPVLEYLRSTGHPVHPLSKMDPRKSVLTLWIEGGFISAVGSSDFVPHFIVREVKKRYALSTLSSDIVSTLERIRLQQEKVKRAEQSLMVDRDYRHILKYFKELGDLRAMENKLRDVLVSELDISRAEKDSAEETMGIVTEQLGEVEMQFIAVAEDLNAQLANVECLCESMLRERLKAESELQRLGLVVESFIDVEKDRSRRGGGQQQALCMWEVSEECNQEIFQLHERLRSYRDMRDDRDDALRQRVRSQVDEIAALQSEVRRLHEQNEQQARAAELQQDLAARKLHAMMQHAMLLVEREERNTVLVREAYASALRHATVASQAQGSQSRTVAVVLQEMARRVHVAAEEVRHAERVAAMAVAELALQAGTGSSRPASASSAKSSKNNNNSGSNSRPTSPAASSTKRADKAKPAGGSRATSASPTKKRKGAADPGPGTAEEASVGTTAGGTVNPSLAFVPPTEFMSFCYRLGAALGIAADSSFLSLRQSDECLHMADEDRVARELATKERQAQAAWAAEEAEKAAAAAASKAKASRAGGKSSAKSPSVAAATAGRPVSPAPSAKGDAKKKGGRSTTPSAAAAKKGRATGASPSPSPLPAKVRAGSPAKSAGPAGKQPAPAAAATKDRPRSVSPAPKKPPAKK